MLNRPVASLCLRSLFTLLAVAALLHGITPKATAQTIPNPSFEADHYFSGVGYASQNGGIITGWAPSDPTRIGLNLGGTNTPGLFVDNGAIPNGTNVAFIQAVTDTTNSLSTTIASLIPGVQYQVKFRANSRGAYTTPGAIWSLNGGPSTPFICAPAVGGSNPYYTNSGIFAATNTTAALVLRNGITNGDGAVLLDNFSIGTVPQTLVHYRVNAADASSVTTGSIPNLGVLGRGTNGGAGVTLTSDIPTLGVARYYGDRAIVCNGSGGILAPGRLQLTRTNIANAGGFTYEAWVKWNGNGSVNSIIDYAGTEKLVRRSTDSGPVMETDNASFDLLAPAGANQWHYVAVVFTPTSSNINNDSVTGNYTFYVDTNTPTATVANVTITSFGDSLNRTIGVGMHPIGFASDFFNGLIYEPRVSLGALPANELLFKSTAVVTSVADSGPGTLRDAVSNSMNAAIITFAPGLSGQTIVLTNGQIELSNSITINAAALANGMRIDGNGQSRIFQVDGGTFAELNSLTLTNGGGVTFGGGIHNSGTLILDNCSLVNNNARGADGASFANGEASQGGGINNIGTLTLNNTVLANNSSSGGAGGFTANGGDSKGGGICNAGPLILNGSNLTNNNANAGAAGTFASGGNSSGGGIYNVSVLTMTNSTLASNNSNNGNQSFGGGIYNAGGLTVNNSTLANNNITGNQSSGGGIYNTGFLAVTNSVVANNNASGNQGLGGGLFNSGGLTLETSLVAGNRASGNQSGEGSGGGIYNLNVLTVNKSSVASNNATGGSNSGFGAAGNSSGGGIYNAGVLTLQQSTLANNRASAGQGGQSNNGGTASGGGLFNSLQLTLNNCTLAENIVSGGDGGAFASGANGSGGGIYNVANVPVILNYATVVNNHATGGVAGVFGGNGSGFGGGILTVFNFNLVNSIVCSNTAASNPNISGSYTAANDLVDADALLAPLGNYGGPTQTMPPQPGSPAINAGGTTTLTSDQRGLPRSVGVPDIGAVEIQAGEAQSVVLNANDSGSGSLRQTILNAPGNGNITFAASLAGQTILLTSGQLLLNKNLAIDGRPLAPGIQINGNGTSRIFQVGSGVSVSLHALTLTNGNPGGGNAGGAVYNSGTLQLDACTLAGNVASQGGALENLNAATLICCTFAGNHAVNNGGAIDNNTGPLGIFQSTIFGNSAGGSGGGIANFLNTLTLTNCIVAGNTGAGPDLYNFGSSSITAFGENIVPGYQNFGSFVVTSSLITSPPLLAALGSYGGPTPTMPPLLGSPALDGGNDGFVAGFATDQRGQPRVFGAHVDIGAVEGGFNPSFPLVNLTKLGDGNVQFSFDNLTGPTYHVLASPDVAAPINTWTDLGAPLESPAGTFTFTDLQATNYPSRFYRVTTP